MTDSAWLRAVREALARKMTALLGAWHDDGTQVIGPGTLAIRAEVTHDSEPGHVDLGFVLNRTRPDAPIIWDCVSGGSDEDADAAWLACHLWTETTAATILELIEQRGERAAHAHRDPTLGLASWHSIHGPVLGYGRDDARELQQWMLEHAVVPLLRDVLEPALATGLIHGVKFLMGAFDGDSIAEVRIDGLRHDACSDALLALPWPKAASRVVRCFVLFVHPVD